MEMLLKDGLVKDVDNKKKIEFLESNEDTESKFGKSFSNVIELIEAYDIKKSNIKEDKDVYLIYCFKTNSDEVEKTLSNVMSGNTKDILNIDESHILYSINEDDPESIFWDVLNDLIIVIGRDNLKTLMLEIEKKRWDCIKIQNEAFMKEYMELCASKVYKKVMKNNNQ